jgi:hypothetical protein
VGAEHAGESFTAEKELKSKKPVRNVQVLPGLCLMDMNNHVSSISLLVWWIH